MSCPMQPSGRFIIFTQKAAFSKVYFDDGEVPSKSSTRKRLSSKTHGHPSKTRSLSLGFAKSIMNRFSPSTLKDKLSKGFHHFMRGVLIVSLLTHLSANSLPKTWAWPRETTPYNSSLWMFTSASSPSVKES